MPGCDAMDRRYLGYLAENYAGGPVGVETLAAVLAEQRDMLKGDRALSAADRVADAYPRGRCLGGGMGPSGGTAEARRQLDMLTDLGPDDDG